MVEWSRSGISSISATSLSSSRNDHRDPPGGGVEQANAINRASTSPVIADGTGGCSAFFRAIVTHTSPSVSTNRSATERTVSPDTPSRPAITSFGNLTRRGQREQTGPPDDPDMHTVVGANQLLTIARN